MNIKADTWHPYKGRTIPNVVTRVSLRAHLREFAVGDITERFPVESRANRRAMGFIKGNRDFREKRGLPEPRKGR